MEKFVCIHGHFYQPPRENPWLEAVELQDSASPYHDWNERVTVESYAPNSRARFLNSDGRIERIVSNYSRISFNFGPTLLAWMKARMPAIFEAIVEADRESQKRFSGHGSALAQGYNHIIMPLANRRDKETQVVWGIRCFEKWFGRQPEGMWLPETAVDDETLEVLAEHGIQFTILSPYQASQVRPLAGGDWQDVNGGRIDPSMPYRVSLPSGRSIVAFFYDAPIAQAVAFEQLLRNGEQFARRLLAGADDSRGRDQLVHIATDGESYGHHYRYGDMALAYALDFIKKNHDANLTIYGEYLEGHPPTHEARVHQASSWSCPHGVDRWKRHCGCNSGGHADWNQQWREPLRNALDWLRDRLAPQYETKAKELLKDPWRAREDYISVILDRSSENIAHFFREHATRELNQAEQVTALRLLEMQRHALLMYTSCGWFFDEISGLETVQVIQYAARAIQLAAGLFDENPEPGFLDILGQARSNLREHRDGREIYEKFVKPAIMSREMAGAHYAISSLFESYPEDTRIYSFTVQQQDRQVFSAGSTRLAVGRIVVGFETTRNSDVLTYAVVHMGDHNLNCGVRLDGDLEAYSRMKQEMHAAFGRADFAEIIRLMDGHFGGTHYSLKNLFRDEQRRALNQILAATRTDIHNTYRLITDRYAPLTRFLANLHTSSLKSLKLAAEVVLNSDLQHQFESDNMDIERVRGLLGESEAAQVALDKDSLAYAFKAQMERLSGGLLASPRDIAVMDRFLAASDLLHSLPFEVNLWGPQNAYYDMLKAVLPEMQQLAGDGDADAAIWTEKFLRLGELLGFHVSRREPERAPTPALCEPAMT
jgi:alpha-amylase/alpha-mannosidase (GH57 family)